MTAGGWILDNGNPLNTNLSWNCLGKNVWKLGDVSWNVSLEGGLGNDGRDLNSWKGLNGGSGLGCTKPGWGLYNDIEGGVVGGGWLYIL